MKKHPLVDMEKINSTIIYDIRYATENNFTKEIVYDFPLCYVHRDLAPRLDQIQKDLAKRELNLKIYDGFRPLHVNQKFWDLIQDERYVRNPNNFISSHSRGTAIDVTLVDLEGKELEMPTEFDDFTERAHHDYVDLPEHVIKNRALLREVMEANGFEILQTEWWHYNFRGWEEYSAVEMTLQELVSSEEGVNAGITAP